MAPAAEAVWDPHWCNIEETIDEFERRIKCEEVRYSKLIANRRIYEQWMGQSATKGLMRDAAIRLVNFDPNFDTEPEPLPRPWLHYQPRPSGYYHEYG